MNSGSIFDPSLAVSAMEEWQKFWFRTDKTPSQSSSGASQVFDSWQKQMQDATAFWQNAWAEVLPKQVDEQTGETHLQAWRTLPWFANIKNAYDSSCEFIRKQLEANAAGLPDERKESLRFMTEQYLAAMNPDNFLATNPEALQEAFETQGQSLVKGVQNYLHDFEQGKITMSDGTPFILGENTAATPGKVVLRTELYELLQYAPSTEKVFEKPLLIIPPCVNKYYLMDLAPQKSLIEYLVSQGFRVFLVSWKSATPEMKHFTWDTYVERGVINAIDTVRAITKKDSINALGFCIGGVLLTTALAVLKARGNNYVDNVLFMTSMVDHSDPGDIKHFITEEFMRNRLAQMEKGGIVSGLELQATFSFLRPQDLVWNYVRDNYLKGKTPRPFDMLSWNSDSVDLPMPMHTYFLQKCYVENALIKKGGMTVCGVPVDISTIDIPMYFYASETDHIVLAHSVYDGIKYFSGCPEKRFVLGESGHIAGAINPVSKNRRSYWTGENLPETFDEWREQSENHKGSWWVDAVKWFGERSGKEIKATATFGNSAFAPVCDAPGEYVRAKALPALKTHFV